MHALLFNIAVTVHIVPFEYALILAQFSPHIKKLPICLYVLYRSINNIIELCVIFLLLHYLRIILLPKS